MPSIMYHVLFALTRANLDAHYPQLLLQYVQSSLTLTDHFAQQPPGLWQGLAEELLHDLCSVLCAIGGVWSP